MPTSRATPWAGNGAPYWTGQTEMVCLRDAIRQTLELIVSATMHRWKFSHARATDPEPFIWWPEESVGFAGDAFGGSRIEGAAVSGLTLAEPVKLELASRPGHASRSGCG